MREELIEPICTIDNCPDCLLEVCILDKEKKIKT